MKKLLRIRFFDVQIIRPSVYKVYQYSNQPIDSSIGILMNLPSSERSILKRVQKIFKTWLLYLLQLAGPQKLHKKNLFKEKKV